MPVFNEKETLHEILRRVRAVAVTKEIILVDDGSTDGTRELLRGEIEGNFPDVRVLYHDGNQGKGASILTALKAARGEFVVVQDADLEYDPEEYVALLEPLRAGQADVVYGSRFRGSVEAMRLPNLVANKVLTFAANALFGARLTDEATCYKMFRRDVLVALPLRARRFDFCPEVTAKVRKRGHHIREVPIHYRARTVGSGKKIRWTDGVEALWALIKYRFID